MSYSGNSAGGTEGSGFSRFPQTSPSSRNASGDPGRRLGQTADGDEAYSTAPGTTSFNNSAGGTSRSRRSTAAHNNFAGPGHRLGGNEQRGKSWEVQVLKLTLEKMMPLPEFQSRTTREAKG
ncbi:hypothetical protein I350_02145 [Cryptococcus amylolentus CBS 6273]|uniref:Uncharacterized protein n=1 Tax=Cryptococcus amylolentus CBS 6273 TaxID=1296118 RepID=A0A1E3KCB5_9TREE|nr:hypothetical protein I350_02145 [Cryptococcus amylolentus CBS 6273]